MENFNLNNPEDKKLSPEPAEKTAAVTLTAEEIIREMDAAAYDGLAASGDAGTRCEDPVHDAGTGEGIPGSVSPASGRKNGEKICRVSGSL